MLVRTIKAKDLLVERRPVEWIYKPYIPRGCITVLAARGGVGKSALALAIAANGCKVSNLRVLYIDLEQSLGHIRDRIEEWQLAECEILFLVDEDPNCGVESASPTLAAITEQAIVNKIDLIIIDSLTAMYDKHDVESRRGASILMNQLRGIATATNAGLLVLAHTTKNIQAANGPSDISVDQIAGSKAVTDLARSVIGIQPNDSDPTLRHLHHLKCNFAECAEVLNYRVTDCGLEIDESNQYSIRETKTKTSRLYEETLSAIQSGCLQDKRAIRSFIKSIGGEEVDASRIYKKILNSGIIQVRDRRIL